MKPTVVEEPVSQIEFREKMRQATEKTLENPQNKRPMAVTSDPVKHTKKPKQDTISVITHH